MFNTKNREPFRIRSTAKNAHISFNCGREVIFMRHNEEREFGITDYIDSKILMSLKEQAWRYQERGMALVQTIKTPLSVISN